MTNPPESELETWCEWVCVVPYIDHCGGREFLYVPGGTYYFHEDAPPFTNYFQMVVNEQDEPVTKLVRKS